MARMPRWPALAAPAAQPLSAGGLPGYGALRWPLMGELPPAAARAAAVRLLGAHPRCGTTDPQGIVVALKVLGLSQGVHFWMDILLGCEMFHLDTSRIGLAKVS